VYGLDGTSEVVPFPNGPRKIELDLAAYSESFTRGRIGGTATAPHLTVGFRLPAMGCRDGQRTDVLLCFERYRSGAGSPLARRHSLLTTLFYFTCRKSPRSREANFKAMGLQSYSRVL
jgi:hypothetical protein